jgi:hypothetical protein
MSMGVLLDSNTRVMKPAVTRLPTNWGEAGFLWDGMWVSWSMAGKPTCTLASAPRWNAGHFTALVRPWAPYCCHEFMQHQKHHHAVQLDITFEAWLLAEKKQQFGWPINIQKITSGIPLTNSCQHYGLENIACPMKVVSWQNLPRVWGKLSRGTG